MIRSFVIAAMSAAALCVSTAAPAQQTEGTAFEARAMLTKAVAAVKEDKTKALDMFNKGESGFRDRDLYVFCHSISEAKLVATGNPNRKQELGSDLKTGVDAGGANISALKSGPPIRSLKAKSPRWTTCIQSQALTKRRWRKRAS